MNGKSRKPHQFQPGWKGGPGRPKGSRNKLGEDFIGALYEDFQVGGAEAIKECREKEPSTYVRVVAGLLPKELEIKRVEQTLTDEQLAELIDAISGELASREGEVPEGTGESQGAALH